MRHTVYNHFKPSAAQNGCEPVGQTADGIDIFTIDKGKEIAVLVGGILYRVDFARDGVLDKIKSLNLIERCNQVVVEVTNRINDGGLYCGAPALFAIVGKAGEWDRLKALVNERKEAQEARKADIRAEHERAEAEALAVRINQAETDYKAGKHISGDMFEALLIKHDIKAPVRTIGWIRKALHYVHKGGYVAEAKRATSLGMFPLMRALTDKLNQADER